MDPCLDKITTLEQTFRKSGRKSVGWKHLAQNVQWCAFVNMVSEYSSQQIDFWLLIQELCSAELEQFEIPPIYEQGCLRNLLNCFRINTRICNV